MLPGGCAIAPHHFFVQDIDGFPTGGTMQSWDRILSPRPLWPFLRNLLSQSPALLRCGRPGAFEQSELPVRPAHIGKRMHQNRRPCVTSRTDRHRTEGRTVWNRTASRRKDGGLPAPERFQRLLPSAIGGMTTVTTNRTAATQTITASGIYPSAPAPSVTPTA